MRLPKKGKPADELFRLMRRRKRADADWRGGRTWSLVYPAGEKVDEVLAEANRLYLYENALNPMRFPSIKEMEKEVVDMTLGLLNAPKQAAGTMTSGGTESILLAVKTARNRGREEKGIDNPQILIPASAHPAFTKAGEYLGVEVCRIPLDKDLKADTAAAAGLITKDTVMMAGSAPNYPHGIIDPIEDLAAMAAERSIAFHTDACVGGFMLPFLERLGHDLPLWDFRVPGVTTISADVHKYGYATKGASVIAHRETAMLRHQMFLYDQWPGGLYGSPAMAGARPAAPIATAWAVMNYLGEEGYLRLAAKTFKTTRALRTGIQAIDGLKIWGQPEATVLSFGSASLDIMAVGDVMDERGWHLDRQNNPDALHMIVSPNHARIVADFLDDLAQAVAGHGASKGKQARYN